MKIGFPKVISRSINELNDFEKVGKNDENE